MELPATALCVFISQDLAKPLRPGKDGPAASCGPCQLACLLPARNAQVSAAESPWAEYWDSEPRLEERDEGVLSKKDNNDKLGQLSQARPQPQSLLYVHTFPSSPPHPRRPHPEPPGLTTILASRAWAPYRPEDPSLSSPRSFLLLLMGR